MRTLLVICLYRLPIPGIWMSTIICQLDYPRCKTKNRRHSIDAHVQNGAGSVSLSLLHIKAAYTSFMNVCIQLLLILPKVQHQKSLTSR